MRPILPEVDVAKPLEQRIVGSVESQAIAPAGGWTEEDRRRFKDSLLEILSNEGKFDQQLPSNPPEGRSG
jgi:hypothetical protein